MLPFFLWLSHQMVPLRERNHLHDLAVCLFYLLTTQRQGRNEVSNGYKTPAQPIKQTKRRGGMKAKYLCDQVKRAAGHEGCR